MSDETVDAWSDNLAAVGVILIVVYAGYRLGGWDGAWAGAALYALANKLGRAIRRV